MAGILIPDAMNTPAKRIAFLLRAKERARIVGNVVRAWGRGRITFDEYRHDIPDRIKSKLPEFGGDGTSCGRELANDVSRYWWVRAQQPIEDALSREVERMAAESAFDRFIDWDVLFE